MGRAVICNRRFRYRVTCMKGSQPLAAVHKLWGNLTLKNTLKIGFCMSNWQWLKKLTELGKSFCFLLGPHSLNHNCLFLDTGCCRVKGLGVLDFVICLEVFSGRKGEGMEIKDLDVNYLPLLNYAKAKFGNKIQLYLNENLNRITIPVLSLRSKYLFVFKITTEVLNIVRNFKRASLHSY